jgi:predicted MarR family transcription regulator
VRQVLGHRLDRVNAAVPKPVAEPVYDLSRLSAEQLERMAEIRARVDAVGLEGLTDAEVEEVAAIAELMTPLPLTTERRG